MSFILDGRVAACARLSQIQTDVKTLSAVFRAPCLAVILVGNDPASAIYVGRKHKTCEDMGIRSLEYRLPEATGANSIKDLIHTLNQDEAVDGILLQVPLPQHLNAQESQLLQLISPEKDVDGFHPINIGRLLLGQPGFRPCTPTGVIALLRYYNLPSRGKHVVIVGRSNIVGKPQAALFLLNDLFGDATVTVCHSKSQHLSEIVRQGDIVVAAVGKPQFITADMIKPGAIVIDVGINRISDPAAPKGTRIVGDVDFESVKNSASWITPVPGGVGQMTIAELMANTYESCYAAYQRSVNAPER